MSMNRICLMGRIGRDLELKKTNSGVSVVSFPLAVDRNGKEGGTDWIDVVAWRGTAEVLCNYADKGRRITTPPHRNTPQRAPQAALQRSARTTASCRFKGVVYGKERDRLLSA